MQCPFGISAANIELRSCYSCISHHAEMKAGERIGRYHLLKELGENTYARVFAAKNLETARDVAIKVAKPEFDRIILQEETNLLRHISSDHIVQLLDVQDRCLVMELAEFSLLQYFESRQHKPFSEEETIAVAYGLLCGLRDLHESRIVHRGVSPTNVLLYKQPSSESVFPFHVALGDLSASKQLIVLPAVPGANLFVAPEIIQGGKYSQNTDIWSAGVTLLWMLTGQTRVLETPALMVEALSGLQIGEELKQLISDCIQLVPAKRPTAAQVLERAVLKSFSAPSHDGRFLASKHYRLLSEIQHGEMLPQQAASLMLGLLQKLQAMPPGLYDIKPSMLLVEDSLCGIQLVSETAVSLQEYGTDLELYSLQPLAVHDGEDQGSGAAKAWAVACLCHYVSAGVLPFFDKTLRLVNKRIESGSPAGQAACGCPVGAVAAAVFSGKPGADLGAGLKEITYLPVDFALFSRLSMRAADAEARLRVERARVERAEQRAQRRAGSGGCAVCGQVLPDYKRLVSSTSLQHARGVECSCGLSAANLFQAASLGCLRCSATFYGQAGLRDPNNLGSTALQKAARGGFLEVCQLLLDPEVTMMREAGLTALMCAANWGHLRVVQLLAPWEKGLSDSGDSALTRAAIRGHTACFEYLENLPEERKFGEDLTYLMLACIKGRPEQALGYLGQAGAKTAAGRTALMFAAANGSAECVRMLLKAEAGLQAEDGETALFVAAWKGHAHVVELLAPLEAGLKTRDGWTALMCAAQNGNLACVALLAPLEARATSSDGATAIMRAAQLGRVQVVKALLQSEAKMQQPDGWSALMWAVSRCHVDAVELLAPLEKGLRDAAGQTALQKTLADVGMLGAQQRCAQILWAFPEERAALSEADAALLKQKFKLK